MDRSAAVMVATMLACAAACQRPLPTAANGSPPSPPRQDASARAAAAPPPAPVGGQVNLQTAVRESDAGQQAAGKLKTVFEDKQRKLDELQALWKQDHDRLEKRKGILSDAAYKSENDALQKRLAALQQTWLDFQKDLNDKDAQAVTSLLGRARGCASQVGDALGLQAVYDKSDDTILWSRGGKDASDAASRAQARWELTSDVIRCINGVSVPLAATASNQRAGRIDLGFVVTGSRGGLLAKEQLKKLHAQRQQELDEAQAVLTREKEKLESRKASMSAARFAKEADAFQARIQQLHGQFAAAQEELKQREQQLVAPLMSRARECTAKVAASLALAAIFETGDESVVWSRPGQDVSDPWLRRQSRADVAPEVLRCVDESP